ncbi:hypothetical protein Ae168Ps1_2738 [Pseudonocardia sp. Ae168_Ps1]|uniref:ATP-binding protein n=1 Tax=unclassified Pseudonocardia TaxID=2619320 RepID=UPI00094B7899|nr:MULTISPECIES: ATP-binding protein [unclassified Pseudonocardia]OLL74352.1 hypothetical protein Ae150APs1_2730 [Pseudonocardia sp. Ae150A_Ps1]OLL80332.1 hypothetical protein Ae168Ps1_2738 [Pseudonocardia sp. Ae168_Ps1]OLL85541.1 hypothetical protein Ae263Ps1_2596c [Pseudonocardia sp. Ae263_Ps1]OLL94432.1 hypothetical protein Ae356Ps1_4329 [Pseudonocardia sp. Ae356_Ps1]
MTTHHLYEPGRLRITPAVADNIDEHVIPLGYTEAGLATADLNHDPHVLVAGPPGSGKTATARGLAAYLLAAGWGAIITGHAVCQTYGTLAGWSNTHVREPEAADAEDLATLVRAEAMRRFEIMRAAQIEHRAEIEDGPRRFFRPLVIVEDGAGPVASEKLAHYAAAAIHVVRVTPSVHALADDQHHNFTTRLLSARPGHIIDTGCWTELVPAREGPPPAPGPHLTMAGEAAAPRPIEPIVCDHHDLEACAHAGARKAALDDGYRHMRLAEALGTRPGAISPTPDWLLLGGDL